MDDRKEQTSYYIVDSLFVTRTFFSLNMDYSRNHFNLEFPRKQSDISTLGRLRKYWLEASKELKFSTSKSRGTDINKLLLKFFMQILFRPYHQNYFFSLLFYTMLRKESRLTQSFVMCFLNHEILWTNRSKC